MRSSAAGSRPPPAPQALIEAASRPADWVMSAIVGAAGLAPGLAALRAGRDPGTGQQGNPGLRRGAGAGDRAASRRATAAGGQRAFRGLPGAGRRGHGGGRADHHHRLGRRLPRLAARGAGKRRRLAEASSHPNWDMGQRITIDSASMFNKALELIETKEYFGVDRRPDRGAGASRIPGPRAGRVPRRRADGPCRTARHAPCHRLCAALARAPAICRSSGSTSPRIGQLNFSAPDDARYPALRLARAVMRRGGLAGAVFNAAKEARPRCLHRRAHRISRHGGGGRGGSGPARGRARPH